MVKTKPSDDSVDDFLAGVIDDRRRTDALAAVEIMRAVTGAEPVLWGSMVGFGRQPYTTADGRSHETFAVGLAPRKQALTLYGLTYYGSNQDLLDRLGAHTTGKGCLYIRRLDDVDLDVLREMIARGWATNHTA
ncbi:DUF1801 domain-containing protein [Gordonia phthalatica]|uniref:YdhG-like domain-containing protein n=1 Tax=Gordonia phthalatica TaxID=1136941 RepID=A0A0N9NBZ0_9ACTN|nr:DUF1801 domain-containing protein [Gordonia phthalatica]ALG85110.1 hypothetical protein ACH46_12260 [Gordonia phthalatica]